MSNNDDHESAPTSSPARPCPTTPRRSAAAYLAGLAPLLIAADDLFAHERDHDHDQAPESWGRTPFRIKVHRDMDLRRERKRRFRKRKSKSKKSRGYH